MDGLHVTKQWEHQVYAVLRAKQEALPAAETIGIFPPSGGPHHTAHKRRLRYRVRRTGRL